MEKCLQRGLPPNWAMSTGIPGEIMDFLKKARAETCYKIVFLDTEQHHVVFEVDKGSVVLDSFDIDEDISRNYKLEIKALNGYVTIVDQLETNVIYQRILAYYKYILDNYQGKSNEELMALLGLVDTPNIKYKLNPKYIENSKDFIRSLPSYNADKELLIKLIQQVLSGKGNDSLEYGYYSRDIYSVEMHQYAKALAKKIEFNLPF